MKKIILLLLIILTSFSLISCNISDLLNNIDLNTNNETEQQEDNNDSSNEENVEENNTDNDDDNSSNEGNVEENNTENNEENNTSNEGNVEENNTENNEENNTSNGENVEENNTDNNDDNNSSNEENVEENNTDNNDDNNPSNESNVEENNTDNNDDDNSSNEGNVEENNTENNEENNTSNEENVEENNTDNNDDNNSSNESNEENNNSEINEDNNEEVSQYSVKTILNNEEVTLTITANTGLFVARYSDGVLTIDAVKDAENTTELTFEGSFNGSVNIQTDTENEATVIVNLSNAKIVSTVGCPLFIDGEADISAKKGTLNYITDNGSAREEYSSAIYVTGDLKLKGTGTLEVYSKNNNGIHTKDDLKVQKLTLNVNSVDNALKGNDSVTVESGSLTLISRQGDGIKTTNSDLSSSGKQRGTITLLSGGVDIYAACDGLDAAYNVEISGDVALNIYTDKYSSYSEEVTAVSDSIYYIRWSNSNYKFSIYYYNSSTDYKWVNSTTYVTASNGRSTYYYYQISKETSYSNFVVYVYDSSQSQGQSSNYYTKSGTMSHNDNYDTIAYSRNRFGWTNYQTTNNQSGMFPGGMNDGNNDKGDYSTKGIKADNAIIISGGIINVKSYDDAIHANCDNTLENGVSPLGNVTISGGTLTLYSNDDGIHADNVLTISGDLTIVKVTNSYEGLEGVQVLIQGGTISVTSSDDGINSTNASGVGIQIDGGYLYVYAGGDGIDANSKTQYQGIIFNGGKVVVISTSGGNSCIDTEKGYTYNGGKVIAMCPTGMQSESYNCQSTNKKYTTMSLSGYVTVSNVATVKLPKTIDNGFIIYLGSSSVTFQTQSTSSLAFDDFGVSWN